MNQRLAGYLSAASLVEGFRFILNTIADGMKIAFLLYDSLCMYQLDT